MVFSVRQENNRIIVTALSAETEVRWFCSVDGNFVLSSYGGVAPSELEIFTNDEDHIAKGIILFNYYDGDCIRQETLQPYLYEKGWGVVYPERETFEIGPNNQYKPFTVRTNNSDWTVNITDGYHYIKVSDTKFYLIKNKCDSEVTVSATINVDESNAVVYINEVDDPRAVVNPAPKMVTGLVYNGRAQALVTGGRAQNGTMMYKVDDGDWSTEIPRVVNASPDNGYTVCYMAKGNPGYRDSEVTCIPGCIIAKAEPVIESVPEFVITTYNGEPQTLVEGGIVSGGYFIYKLGESGTPSQEKPMGTNAGEYTILYYIKGDDNHKDSYNWSTIISKIEKATPVINPEPIGSTLTYAGGPQYLASVGVTDLGTLQYSLDNSAWQTFMVTGTNVGSYTVYYRVSGDTNLYEVTGQTNASIAKVTPTVIPPKGLTLGYTGKEQELIIAGSTDFGTLEYKISGDPSYSTAIPSGKTPQDYVVYYMVEGDDNINTVSGDVLSKISDAIPSYTPPIAKTGLVFNDEFQELFTSGSVTSGQGVMYYSFIDDTTQVDEWETDVLTASGASAYTVYWYVSGITPYESTEVSTLDIIIDKAHTEPKPTPTGLTLVYDESGRTQTLLETGETSGGTMVYYVMSADTEEGVTIEWSEEVPSGITAGTYEIAYMLSGDSNHYDSESATTSSTIDKLTLTFNPSPKANAPLIYNGELQDLVVSGKVGNWDDGVIEYSEDYATWSSGTPQASEIGTYTIYWRALGDENHYDFTGGNISAEIKRGVAKIIVVPEAVMGIEYDGNMHELVSAGTAENGTMVYRIGNGEWSTSLPKAKDTGVYVVYFKASGDTGFDDSEMMSLNCSIGVAVPDYDPPTGLTIEYDGQAHALVTAGTVRSGGTMKYSLDGATWSTDVPTASDKGTYMVYWKVDGDEGYASIGPYQVATTIAKSVPSFNEPTAKTGLVYNGSEQDLINPGTIYDGEGTFYYNVNDGEYSTSIPKGTNPGSYTVGWKIDDGTYGSGTLSVSIAKKTPTVTAPEGCDTSYTGEEILLLTSCGSISDDLSLEYRLGENGTWTTDCSSIKATNIGTYTIYYKFDGNDYYNTVPTNQVTATIGGSGGFTPPGPIENLVWNDSGQTLVSAGTLEGIAGTFYYKLDTQSEFSTELTKATEPNSGYVTEWKVDDGATYSGICITPIAKRTPTVIEPVGQTLTYIAGQEQELLQSCGSITDEISDNLSLEYRLGDDGDWTTVCSSITATEMATYTIWYRFVGNEHYNSIGPDSVESIIQDKDYVLPIPRNLTYNGEAQQLATPGTVQNQNIMIYRVTGSGWGEQGIVPSGITAGTYVVYYKYDPRPEIDGSIECVIKKADNTIKIVSGNGDNIESITITDQETASVKAVSYSGDGTVSIVSSDPSIITISEDFVITPVGIGNCTITASITEGTNFFSASSAPMSVTVTQSAQYTFTVYSDVEGATVKWKNGDTVVSTGVITGGVCQYTTGGYNSLDVNLSKDDLPFEHNNTACTADEWVLITNANPFVEINGVEWATKNLGQTSITGLGSTYMWGATTECSWGSAWDSGYDITTDRSNHDIAYIQSSGNLAIPTLNDINSIGTPTTDDYSLTINGVNGVLFVDKSNGNSVYIPVGFYWTTVRHEYGTDIGYAEFMEVQEEGGTWNGNEAITNCNLIRPIKYTAPFYPSKQVCFRIYGLSSDVHTDYQDVEFVKYGSSETFIKEHWYDSCLDTGTTWHSMYSEYCEYDVGLIEHDGTMTNWADILTDVCGVKDTWVVGKTIEVYVAKSYGSSSSDVKNEGSFAIPAISYDDPTEGGIIYKDIHLEAPTPPVEYTYTFIFYNNSSSYVDGSVEIFYGDKGYSMTFSVSADGGGNYTVVRTSSANLDGLTIKNAYIQGDFPSGSADLGYSPSTFTDGGTIYLFYPNI